MMTRKVSPSARRTRMPPTSSRVVVRAAVSPRTGSPDTGPVNRIGLQRER